MVNLQHLKQLLIFAQEGTLSRTSEVLHISQPSLTRNMKNLEDSLGIQIFERSKNKLSLTEVGEYTVQQAKELLEREHDFLNNVKLFSLKTTTLFGGISAPGVEYEIRTRLAAQKIIPQIQIELHDDDYLLNALLNEYFHFIVTDYYIQRADVLSSSFFMEQLYLSVPPEHPYASKKSLTLKDLEHLTMLLRSDLGIWQPLVDSLTQTKFIIQNDWTAYEELISASALPTFSTNITQLSSQNPTPRIHIPILDKKATKLFYVSVLKKNQTILKQLIE